MDQKYEDWCPLCGTRFLSGTIEEMVQKIEDHIDSGYCEENFKPLFVALEDDCYDKH